MYKRKKKITKVLSLLPLFVNRTRKEGKKSRRFKISAANWISTRRVMGSKMKDPGCNNVILGRRETANVFKIGKELKKGKSVGS